MNDYDIVTEVAKLEDPENWQLLAKSRNYLNSRDAIVPVIKKVITNDALEMKFNYALYDKLKPWQGKYAMTFVTPRQLCVALLEAMGSWMEK